VLNINLLDTVNLIAKPTFSNIELNSPDSINPLILNGVCMVNSFEFLRDS